MKSLGASVRQRTRKLKKVESPSRLVMGKRLEPAEDTYNLIAYEFCLTDA